MARQPKNPFHPGEILLKEFLAPEGITQAAFAENFERTTRGHCRYGTPAFSLPWNLAGILVKLAEVVRIALGAIGIG